MRESEVNVADEGRIEQLFTVQKMVCWCYNLILLLFSQLDTQLISNILKQVCMCSRSLILNSCVVDVVHWVIVTNSVFLPEQLTSPA